MELLREGIKLPLGNQPCLKERSEQSNTARLLHEKSPPYVNLEYRLREKLSDETMQLCREQILREVQNNPDLVTGVKNFDHFRKAWNSQLLAAKKYQEWKFRYNDLVITGEELDSDLEEVKQLVHIFHQYIHMLSERANSNIYRDFEKCCREFLAGNVTELFISFQYIDSLLHTHDELAKIAPVYVLGIFQKDTSKLYSEWFTSNCSKKIKLSAFSNAKPKIKDKPNNSTANREIQLITYQFLCIFFSQFARIPYDRDLCDYILQIFIPLIGLEYFNVEEKDVCKAVYSGDYIEKESFSKTGSWVHPLLQEIENRITSSLYLYPDSIPRISFTTRRSPLEKDWINDAEKLVDDAFVNEYLQAFVIPRNGLGCPRITEDIQELLADLMDRTIAKSTKRQISRGLQHPESVAPEILLAYESGFHSACARKIYDEYHSRLLLFLYDYLQSEAFCRGKRIPASGEWRRAEKHGMKLWIVSDMSVPVSAKHLG